MTSTELKESLLKRSPVRFNGIGYEFISAIIYRLKNENIAVSVELMDKSKNSVTIAPAEQVQLAVGNRQEAVGSREEGTSDEVHT